MRSKKIKPKVVGWLDSKYNWHSEAIQNPLYEVHQEGRYFKIMYHGACGVHTSSSLEDAKEYILNKVAEYKLIQDWR